MYRPSPLVRAYCLEKKLGTPAKIYYKFEGNNTSGSHKLNSAIAQAYYAKQQGLKGVTTETGAGQWGTALSMACAYFDLDCKVYMVKVSYEQKPFRREVMRTYGASVTPSPSTTTEVGKKILEEHPGTTGSLGCAISEAVETATKNEGYRYVLGSVLNQVLLHQSVIGLESKIAMDKYGIKPDIIIGCAGGAGIFFEVSFGSSFLFFFFFFFAFFVFGFWLDIVPDNRSPRFISFKLLKSMLDRSRNWMPFPPPNPELKESKDFCIQSEQMLKPVGI